MTQNSYPMNLRKPESEETSDDHIAQGLVLLGLTVGGSNCPPGTIPVLPAESLDGKNSPELTRQFRTTLGSTTG